MANDPLPSRYEAALSENMTELYRLLADAPVSLGWVPVMESAIANARGVGREEAVRSMGRTR